MPKTKKTRSLRSAIEFPRQSSRPREESEMKLLKTIGEQIYKDLFKKEKSVEWLGFESETSRATIRRIFDGDRNIGIVTLDRVSRALGYKSVVEFFKTL